MKIVKLFLLLGLALFAYHASDAYSLQSSRFVTKKAIAPRARSSWLRMAVTDAPKEIEDSFSMTGMFTNSSPETRRVIPANLDGKVKFKIVYVVLESQYQSALTQACQTINNGKESVAVEAVGYLLEELRNPKVFEQFKEDISSANIFIGSLIFVQELADKVISIHYTNCMTQLSLISHL